MNLSLIVTLCSLVLSSVLGLLVYLTNPRRPGNELYLLLTVALVLWLGSVAGVLTAGTEAVAELWMRQAFAAAALTPTVCALLRRSIMRPDEGLASVFRANLPWVAANVALAAFCQTGWLLREVTLPPPGAPPAAVPAPVYGPGFAGYVVLFLAGAGGVLASYVRDIRRTRGVQRAELQFVLLGAGSGFAVGSAVTLVWPLLTGSTASGQFGSASALLLTIVVAYGIATRRILAVEDAIRRAAGWLFLALFAAVVFAAVHGVGLALASHGDEGGGGFWPHLLAGIVAALTVAGLQSRLFGLAARLVGPTGSDHLDRAIEASGRLLLSVTAVDSLVEHFTVLLRDTLGVGLVRVLPRRAGSFAGGAPDGSGAVVLPPGDPIPACLGARPGWIAVDEVRRREGTPAERAAATRIRGLGAQVALGIHGRAGLAGVVLLGERSGGRLYGPVEYRALQLLCGQAAIALDNARLYTELRDEKSYLDMILAHLPAGVVAAGTDGRITLCSGPAAGLLGRSAAEALVGRPVDELPAPLADTLRATLEGSGPVLDREFPLPSADGRAVAIRADATPFRVGEEGLAGALLVFRDVSRLRQLEEQVRRSDRLASLGTLAAGMAHEIRNPLVSIKTFAQLLPRKYQDEEFRDTFAPIIVHEVERIDTLVRQLLDFASPRAATLEPVSVHGILDESIRLTHHRLRSGRIQVVRLFDAGEDCIAGDRRLLEQAFINLFLNAGDAMDDAGRLTLRTTNRPPPGPGLPGRLSVIVSDTGDGIAPADLPRVFDPFFTTKANGTGLGLSVVHSIVEDHHGEIQVRSAPREGTTFEMVFPLATPGEAPA